MTIDPQKLVDVIYSTLTTYGVRLPARYETESIDDRVKLMIRVAGFVARDVMVELAGAAEIEAKKHWGS